LPLARTAADSPAAASHRPERRHQPGGRSRLGNPGASLETSGALQRDLSSYRLAQGTYPETLDALVPQFIEKLPRDIVNGAPLLYRRVEDGTFLLYSVGWNETDDGGKSVSDIGDLKNVTPGDWVWKNSLKPE
jgi:hypothetical protein